MSAERPVLYYDGDCAFCKRCVVFFQNITGNRVSCRPGFELDAVQFIDAGGSVVSGGEAVLKALAYGGRFRWLYKLYTRSQLFALAVEKAYEFVADNRSNLII